MLTREFHDWIPSFIAVAIAHAAVWYGFNHHQSVDEGPQALPVVQVSLIDLLPPKNRVTALQKKIRPAEDPPAPQTTKAVPEPVADNSLATAQRAAPPASEEYVEPVYSAASLNNQPPAYPLSARRRGIEGTVIIRAQIHDNGHCHHVTIKKSSGHPLLDKAALDAVRDWRFVPARRGSQVITAWVDVPITFRLNN